MRLRRPTILIYLPLVLILVSTSLCAQLDKRLNESWRWVQFTTESGLPSNEIVDVEEGGNGAIWAIAHQGVAWFDHYEWHTIPFPDSLKGSVTRKAQVMRNGDLLICLETTRSNNAYTVSHTGTLSCLPLRSTGSSLQISEAIELEDGSFAFTAFVSKNQEEKLFHQQLKGTVKIQFPRGLQDSSLDINNLWLTRAKHVYVNTKAGVFRFHNGKELIEWLPPSSEYNFLGNLDENFSGDGFLVDAANYPNKGILLWSRGSKPFLSTFSTLSRIIAADISPQREVVLVQQSGSVRIRQNHSWFAMKSVPEQLKHALKIRFRSNGDLWVTTDKALWLFRNSSERWRYVQFPSGDLRNNINEICSTHDNSAWIATGEGVVTLRPDKSQQTIRQISSRRLGVVTAVNEDREGNIWIGSGSAFAGTFRRSGERWKYYGDEAGLRNAYVHKIRKDLNGDLWFLCLAKDYLANDQPGAFRYFQKRFVHWGDGRELLDGRVYSFAEGPAGTYWFGTKEGVSRWSGDGWKHWKSFFGRGFSLAASSDGSAWVANLGIDFPAVIQGDGTIHAMSEQFGIQGRIIYDIKIDESSRIWLATDRGAYAYLNKILTHFSASSGLGASQVNCILPTKEKVYFGTLESGIAILDLTELEHPPRITIQKSMLAGDNAVIQWNAFSYWGNTSPRDIETRYKVDHGDWSSWKTDHEVTLFGLSYGKHIITVQAKDYFGRVGEKQESVASFDIPVPFYLRDSFLWPIGISFSTAIVLFILYLQRRKKFDRELQRHRDRIAQDLHDEIGSNLGTISLISQRLERERGLSGSIKRELADITTMAMQTADTLREIVWYVNPHHDSIETMILHLREISSRMLRDVECSFDAGGLSTGISIDLETRRSIYMMFKETLHNIVKHSRAKHVHIAIVQTTGELQIQVHDDGIGFDTLTSHPGFGLQNLQKRCETLGGTMHIESMVGKGTTIYLRTKIT